MQVTTAIETTADKSDGISTALSSDAVKQQMAAKGFKVDVKAVTAQEPSADAIAAAADRYPFNVSVDGS